MDRRTVLVIAAFAAVLAGFAVIVPLCRASGGNEPPELRAEPTTIASASPTPEATAASPRFMTITGTVWIDARPAHVPVEAFAGTERCDESSGGTGTDGHRATAYTLVIYAAEQGSDCGSEGVPLTIVVDGTPVARDVPWRRDTSLRMDLVVGPRFARYQGGFTMPEQGGGNIDVQATIDGVVCGRLLNPLQGVGPRYPYDIVVDPHDVTPGCGREGALVRFRVVVLRDANEAEVLAFLPEIRIWHAGDGLEPTLP
jgi:hypothetical protein